MMFCVGQYHKLWPTHLNSGQTCLNEKATSTKQPHARIKKNTLLQYGLYFSTNHINYYICQY